MQTFNRANFRELLALQESFVDRPAPTACDHLPEIHRAKTKLAPIRTITTTKNQQVLDQLGWAAKACPVPRACAISLCIAGAPAASSSVPSGAAARSGQGNVSLRPPTSILPRNRLGVAPRTFMPIPRRGGRRVSSAVSSHLHSLQQSKRSMDSLCPKPLA